MVRLYGVLVTLGVVAGAAVAEKVRLQTTACRRQHKKAVDRSPLAVDVSVWDALVWMVIPGVIGARLYHVVDLWWYYRDNLILIPQVWTGGLGIFGAIGGGVLGLWLFCWWGGIKALRSANENLLGRQRWRLLVARLSLVIPGGLPGLGDRRKFVGLPAQTIKNLSQSIQIHFLMWLDLVGVGAPLGQAIGRWGNFFNQELYGKPFVRQLADQGKPPFYAVYISPENRLPGYEQYTHFQPLFLYESVWNLLVFGVLFWLSTRKNKQLPLGTIFTLYIMFYSLGRFFLERLRIEPWRVSVLGVVIPTAQLVSGGLMFGAGLILLRLRLRQVV